MIKINKDIIWIAGGQLAGLISNFILLKVLSNNLSITTFGYYSLWMSVLLFVRQGVYDPISVVTAKASVSDDFFNSKGLSSLQTVHLITLIIFSLLLPILLIYTLSSFILFNRNSYLAYIISGFIYLVSNGGQGIYINIFNATKLRMLGAIGISLDGFTKLCLVSFCVLNYGGNIENVLASIAVSSLLVFLILLFITSSLEELNTNNYKQYSVICKNLFMMSIPLIAPTLLTSLRSVGDRWFMGSILGVEQLAAYSILLQVGFFPMMLTTGMIQTYISPNIYKIALSNRNYLKKYISNILIKIFGFSVIFFLISFYANEFIIRLMTGDIYKEYSKFLPYFVAAGAFSGLSGIANIAVIGFFSTKVTGILMTITVLFSLIITAVLIFMHGFIGGVAGLMFSSLASLLTYLSALYFLRINLE